jgi:hypothetical protein
MTETRKKGGRLQLSVIAAVFFGPLLFAAWLYYKGELIQPVARTNSGALLEPIANLADAVPESALFGSGDPAWRLLYLNAGRCAEDCVTALYTIRQSRKMLGREMDRVQRIFLHGETAPDTVFLDTEHPGLVTLQDSGLAAFLRQKKPAALTDGGYYLIDPNNNLVMYFDPKLDPAEMVDDIKRLLRLSKIG